MKKKVRNNKVILASILALGCLTAASVGFSSWVIAAQDINNKTFNVNVTVADVEDHRFNVDASSKSKIKLGPSTKGPYISYSGSAPEEALDFSFSLTFTSNDDKAFDFTSLGDQSFNINFSFTDTLKINDDGNKYIIFPSGTIGTISKSGFTAKSSGAAIDPQSSNVITYNDKLDWGSYFDSKNPSELTDSTKVDSYIEGLKHLKDCLNNQSNKKFVIAVNIVKAV